MFPRTERGEFGVSWEHKESAGGLQLLANL